MSDKRLKGRTVQRDLAGVPVADSQLLRDEPEEPVDMGLLAATGEVVMTPRSRAFVEGANSDAVGTHVDAEHLGDSSDGFDLTQELALVMEAWG